MSFKHEYAVWFRGVLIDIGTDKAALEREYSNPKYLILPFCKGR